MKTVDTPIGPMQVDGTFVAKESILPGMCMLLGPAGSTGLSPVIWYGPVGQIDEKDFMAAELVAVHPTTYERIAEAAAKVEEGIPYDQPSEA